MISEIIDSIQQQQDKFRLVYQPIVKRDGTIAGVEALLRWEDDDGITHYPDEFIADLEHFGCYVRLGDWIIHKAITDIASIGRDGFFINVNVTWRQLAEPHFAQQVIQELNEAGFPASQLHLEITERERYDSRSMAVSLAVLTEAGVQIVLDDFCTQESSLAIIKRYHIDQLKVEKEFVFDVLESKRSQVIIQCLAELAHKLGMKICLEGVETEETRKFVEQYSADYYQGFLYSGPIEFSMLLGLLQTQRLN